jgi:pectate lyase
MKNKLLSLLLPLGILPLAATATVLVDDTWSSGVRNVQSLPERSAWFGSSASRLVATPGALTGEVDSSRLWMTYFTNAQPHALAVGQSLRVRAVFALTSVAAENGNRGLRVGLFNYGAGTRVGEDGISSSGANGLGVTGYLLNMNFGATFGVNDPLELRRRLGETSSSDNLMGSVPGSPVIYGDYFARGGGASGSPGFVAGRDYTLEFTATRGENGVEVSVTISDGLGWSVSVSGVDSASPVTAFDCFALRPDGPTRTAAYFTFSRFQVDVLGDGDPDPDPDPEPDPDPDPVDGLVLVDDSWSGGVRNVQNLPVSTAWYASSASRLTATTGSMTAEVDGSSRLWATYFTNNAARQLQDGQTLRVRTTFTLTTVNNASTSKGLRVGLFNSENANRFSEDGMSSGDNGSAGVTGYLLNMNFAQNFKVNNPLEIRRRDTVANGSLMGTLGVYSDALANGGGSIDDPAFVEGRVYTFEFSVARDGDSATVTAIFSDDLGWNVSISAVDTSAAAVTAFDTFAIRADNLNNTANFFTFTRFRAEVLGAGGGGETPDLDPAAFASFLAGAEDLGGGWYQDNVFGAFHSPAAAVPYIHLPFKGAWLEVLGTSDGTYYFYDVADETWWATAAPYAGALWGFNYQAWYYFDGANLIAYPDQEDPTDPVDPVDPTDPPPFTAMSVTGYATVAGMGLDTVTGGKGGPVVHVDSIAQLKAEAAGAAPKIIVVHGDFEGGDSISVGSNKTILGAHPGVYLKGIGFEMRNVANVIIRNFRISHVLHAVANDGDGIRVVDGAHHIWIDHCEIFNENPRVQTNKDLYDGLIDITNGSDFVTVSWTHLHNHHKFMLIGSTDTASRYNDDQHLRVTVHHCLLENPYKKDSRIGSRVPSLRFGKAHVFNNVYRNLGEGIHSRHASAHVLVEENVFDYLGYTWFSSNGGCFTLGENLMINEANKNARDVPICAPDFAPPYDYSQFIDPMELVEQLVVEGVGVGKIDPFDGLP